MPEKMEQRSFNGQNSVSGTGRRSALAEFRLGTQGSMAWAAEQSGGSEGL